MLERNNSPVACLPLERLMILDPVIAMALSVCLYASLLARVEHSKDVG